jgi:hypothetical protein
VIRLRAGIALGALLALAPVARAAVPAAGGEALLDASEGAAATVVGVVRQPATVDTHGRSATLEVERSLAGDLAAGASQRIAWEELALARPPRFADGDRVLVALDPLPGASLWRQRFPVTKTSPDVRVVAAAGDAFLRRPDEATIDLLARYLALPPAERVTAPGVGALAALVRGADPHVAAAALRRLGTVPGLDAQLDDAARAALAAAAQDASRPTDLRSALIAWIGRARLVALRPAIEALAGAASPVQADALEALIALDGGLPADRGDALLRSTDPRLRTVGVRSLSGARARERLLALSKNDPAPEVRAAALQRLVDVGGAAAAEDASAGLFDPDRSVRGAAAVALGKVGEPAVPTLLRLAMTRTGDAASGPVVALSLAGPAGAKALVEVARSHDDPEVRKIALFALGHGPKENEVVLDPQPETPR